MRPGSWGAAVPGPADRESGPGRAAAGARAERTEPRTGRALGRAFYARDAETVAVALLGQVLCRRVGGRILRARLVETEAYVGCHDLACHASRGRTARTAVMFGPAGHAYVYLVYGMHHMLNVVTGLEGDAQAVLLRAAEPLEGLEARLDGPGRLARALGITREHNGVDLVASELFVVSGSPPQRVVSAPRVGVEYAGQWAAAPLRFLDADSGHVSRTAAGGRADGLRLPGGRCLRAGRTRR